MQKSALAIGSRTVGGRAIMGVVVTALACGMAAGCGGHSNPVAPSLSDVDPATVLFFDNFDSENSGTGIFNWTSFANWNVLAGCVDLHGNGLFDVQPGNGLYVDLDGSCATGGTIETKSAFTLQSGTYVLEFWIAGNNRINTADTVNVSFGTYQEQFVMQPKDQFRLISRSISVSSQTNARVRFENLGGDGRGALIDLVRIRRTS
jgi:hypothetical protein